MPNWTKDGTRLLETLADSLAGFDHVAEHAHRFDFYAYCEHHAVQRRKMVLECRRVMREHGSFQTIHGTALGSAHRLFLDIRGALDSGVVAILEELIRGETFLASRADAMLDHDHLPEDLYDIVRQIRADISQSLLDLKAMHSHAGKGFAADSFRFQGRNI